jgi:hypothetical protein
MTLKQPRMPSGLERPRSRLREGRPLLLAAIVVLFAMALSARVEPLSAGRRYLDLAARALY